MKNTPIDTICGECAMALGGFIPEGHLATFYEVTCSVCAHVKVCTEPREYRWPNRHRPSVEEAQSKLGIEV